MNADQINTHLLQADIEAASRPADIEWLHAELATAKARLEAGFSADEAAIDPADDGFAGKIAAYERAIAAHPQGGLSDLGALERGESQVGTSGDAACPDRPR